MWKIIVTVKINKIIVTIKHLKNQQLEEGEFDIESIESELAEKRHYTSTNRWVPVENIKNGYVTNTRHTSLISDAVALDYIIFWINFNQEKYKKLKERKSCDDN